MEIKEALNTLIQVVEQYFTGLPKDQRVVQQALQILTTATIPTAGKDKLVKKEEPKKKESDGNK